MLVRQRSSYTAEMPIVVHQADGPSGRSGRRRDAADEDGIAADIEVIERNHGEREIRRTNQHAFLEGPATSPGPKKGKVSPTGGLH
jgi:hypothetical protein